MCRIKSAASTAALQPCPRELSGRACHPRQSCPYLHLPAEITALSPPYQQTQHGDQQLREQDDASWGKEKSTVNHSHRRDHHSAGKSRVVQPEEALQTDSPVSKRRSHRVMRRNTKAWVEGDLVSSCSPLNIFSFSHSAVHCRKIDHKFSYRVWENVKNNETNWK